MANSNTTQHRGWGGAWTEEKLECFENYVKAYLTIMNKYRDDRKWTLFYFDGFAGSGHREQIVEEENDSTTKDDTQLFLFKEGTIVSKELPPYKGAAERVVQLEKKKRGFDYYYFIDKFEENLTRLEFKLSAYETKGKKVFRCGDANEQVLHMAAYMRTHPKAKVLCLLDPFGMSVKWETINALAGVGVDLWILVPTGSIVGRLIQNNGELRFPETLEQFFGLPKEEIYNRFYMKNMVPADLFAPEHEEVCKVPHINNEIIGLYCEQLGTLFSQVTHEPLEMRNSKGVTIFHFVCASNNPAAVKIAQQIFNSKKNAKSRL